MTKKSAINTLMVIVLGGAIFSANAALQTDVHSVVQSNSSEMFRFDESLASSSTSGALDLSPYTYEKIMTGTASASGRTWYGGFEGHATSSNDGSYLGYAASAQSWVDNRWEDSFHFTGNGSATFHFALEGTVATAGHGESGRDYSNQMQLQVFGALNPYGLGGPRFDDTLQNAFPYPGTVFLGDGSFHKDYNVTVSFLNGMDMPVSFAGNGTTWLSSLNYSFRLDSVTFSPDTSAGANVLNASGDLLYSVATVPEADTSAMLLAGMGVLGFVARRRKTDA